MQQAPADYPILRKVCARMWGCGCPGDGKPTKGPKARGAGGAADSDSKDSGAKGSQQKITDLLGTCVPLDVLQPLHSLLVTFSAWGVTMGLCWHAFFQHDLDGMCLCAVMAAGGGAAGSKAPSSDPPLCGGGGGSGASVKRPQPPPHSPGDAVVVLDGDGEGEVVVIPTSNPPKRSRTGIGRELEVEEVEDEKVGGARAELGLVDRVFLPMRNCWVMALVERRCCCPHPRCRHRPVEPRLHAPMRLST